MFCPDPRAVALALERRLVRRNEAPRGSAEQALLINWVVRFGYDAGPWPIEFKLPAAIRKRPVRGTRNPMEPGEDHSGGPRATWVLAQDGREGA